MRQWKLASVLVAGAVGLTACADQSQQPTGPGESALSTGSATIGINVLLNQPATDAILADLGAHGNITGRLTEVNAVFLQAKETALPAIRAEAYVEAANPDAERQGSPVDRVAEEDFSDGINTWDLDAVNVTDFGSDARTVPFDGAGVYVAILDTGLLDTWRQYFPEERIATEYAKSFVGSDQGTIADTQNQWEHDTNSHGTHVTSTVIGYSIRGTPVNGVAPKATVIPVKVLGQQGWGWSSMVARGLEYVADLKAGPLAGSPVVVNMSLGGPVLDAVEQAALDYAISKGVIIVASAGNSGNAGMGYPGAYAPVISVAASGWVGEWVGGRSWWRALDVADPTSAKDFYITDFSSRARRDQDLDVAAPGSWVVGPYQTQNGQTSYYFLGGTSMAAPHVAGIAALMAQKNPALTGPQVEEILQSTAIELAAGCRNVLQPDGSRQDFCWDADATGHGLATADAALNGVSTARSGKKR